MARPTKYATPQIAVENNLYLKMSGPATGLGLEEWLALATSKCCVCKGKPMEYINVDRADGKAELWYNRVVDGWSVCKMCRALMGVATLQDIRSYAARILAVRKHELDMKPFLQAQD